jgi:hypothetical protein
MGRCFTDHIKLLAGGRKIKEAWVIYRNRSAISDYFEGEVRRPDLSTAQSTGY